MSLAQPDLDREAAGRRAYLRGFEEALGRAHETAEFLRGQNGTGSSAQDVAPFLNAQIGVWVAHWSPEASISADERAYRHGFGDVVRSLEKWSAAMADADEQLRDYVLAEVIPWVNDRPRDGFALRSMPRRFAPNA